MKRIASRLLTTVAAVAVAVNVGWAANIPLLTGPQDPSQLNATINALITSVNSGTAGLIAVGTSAMGTFATSTELTLQSVTIPANQLSSAGQSIRARCYGVLGANTNNKTVRMNISNGVTPTGLVFSSIQTSANGSPWELEILATFASSGQTNWRGAGYVGSNGQQTTGLTAVSPIVATNTVVNWASNMIVNCTGIAPTSPGDISNTEIMVEQIK